MSRFRIVSVVLLALACGRDKVPAASTAPPATSSRAAAVPAKPAKATIPQKAPCPPKPNILLISVDTLRFDATSLDPKSRNHTPVLEKLSQRGVNFTRNYSTHDSTPASHFSMLTGFVNGYQTEVDVPEASMAHQLKKKGYRTFGIAANGNLSPTFTRSLAQFGSFVNLQDVWEKMEADRKAALIPKLDKRLLAYDYKPDDWARMMVFSSSSVVLRYLEPKLDGRQPFFGFLNLLDTHEPYLPDPATYDRKREERGLNIPDLRHRQLGPELADPESITDPARKAVVLDAIKRAGGRAWSTSIDLDKKTLEGYHRRYLAQVRAVDAALGRIVALLEERKLMDSTIIIITSDHGEAFGEKNVITHSFVNQGEREVTNRVPLLIVLPPCYDFVPRDVPQLCTIADIPPTIYDLLGIEPHAIWKLAVPGNFGRSLVPFIRSAPSAVPAQTADVSKEQHITPEQRKAQDAEAVKRLRALGYIR